MVNLIFKQRKDSNTTCCVTCAGRQTNQERRSGATGPLSGWTYSLDSVSKTTATPGIREVAW